jgi:hypothetical protein
MTKFGQKIHTIVPLKTCPGTWEVYVADRGTDPGRAWMLQECRLSLHGIPTRLYLPNKEDLTRMQNRSSQNVNV